MSYRIKRMKRRVNSTHKRYRLSFYMSNRNIFAQIIDDSKGTTLVSASSIKDDSSLNMALASSVGRKIASLAISKSIKDITFDRGSAQYKGRVKAFADAARNQGLNF